MGSLVRVPWMLTQPETQLTQLLGLMTQTQELSRDRRPRSSKQSKPGRPCLPARQSPATQPTRPPFTCRKAGLAGPWPLEKGTLGPPNLSTECAWGPEGGAEREAGHPAACSGRAHAPPRSKADAFLWQRASRFPRHGLRPEPFPARSSILSG